MTLFFRCSVILNIIFPMSSSSK